MSKSSNIIPVGLEVEVQMVDVHHQLQPLAKESENALKDLLGPGVSRESDRILEFKTMPLHSVEEAGADVQRLIGDAIDHLQSGELPGGRVMQADAHGHSVEGEGPTPHGLYLSSLPPTLADEVYPAAEDYMAGLHVHLGIEGEEEQKKTADALYSYTPLMLAVTANSPYNEHGNYFGASYRAQCRYGRDEAEPFFRFGTTKKAWDEEHPRPDTLEIMCMDVPHSLMDMKAAAALSQCLAVEAQQGTLKPLLHAEPYTGSPDGEPLHQENFLRVARGGLYASLNGADGQEVLCRDALLRTADRLMPTAVALNCHKELDYIRHITERGVSADQQVALYNQGLTKAAEEGLIEGDAREFAHQHVTEFLVDEAQLLGWERRERPHLLVGQDKDGNSLHEQPVRENTPPAFTLQLDAKKVDFARQLYIDVNEKGEGHLNMVQRQLEASLEGDEVKAKAVKLPDAAEKTDLHFSPQSPAGEDMPIESQQQVAARMAEVFEQRRSLARAMAHEHEPVKEVSPGRASA